MTIKSAAQIQADSAEHIPNNTNGRVSPLDVRQRIDDLADSAPGITLAGLSMMSPEYAGGTGYDTADEAVGASDDQGPLINELLETYGCVYLPRFYSIKTTVVCPNNTEILGRARSGSGLVINANTDGISVNRYTRLNNFRIRGTSTMTAASCCLSIGESVDSARSAFRDLVIGGSSTLLGDSANQDISADGIVGGVCFLNTFDRLYVVNARYGIDICKSNGNTGALLNASIFSGCEFHSCVVGARLGRLKGVTFPGTTFEGCTEHGLILGFCMGVEVAGTYFEANHSSSSASIKADMLVDPAAVGETDPGGGMRIGANWFTKGTGSTYGLYIVKQRQVEITYNGFNSGYATAAIGIGSDNLNIGRIHNNFAPDGIENNNSDDMVES